MDKLVDLHVHSKGSFDGVYDIEELIRRAKKQRLGTLSVTDHNYVGDTVEFLGVNGLGLRNAIHQFDDGFRFIPGVEITCRIFDVKNLKGNPVKMHMLVYCPTLDGKSPLMKLLDTKRKNDIAVDFGELINIAKLKGIDLTEEQIRKYVVRKRSKDVGFSSFGKEDTWQFLKSFQKESVSSYKELTELWEKVPHKERLNLSAKDVIDIAHASGGICIMAHPLVNLNRTNNKKETIDTLIEYGIDGFETMCYLMNKTTDTMIRKECSRFDLKNPMIFTGGSDYHCENRKITMGRIDSSKDITEKSQAGFLSAVDGIQEARSQGASTDRVYDIHDTDIDECLDRYSEEAEKLNAKGFNKGVKAFYKRTERRLAPFLPEKYDTYEDYLAAMEKYAQDREFGEKVK